MPASTLFRSCLHCARVCGAGASPDCADAADAENPAMATTEVAARTTDLSFMPSVSTPTAPEGIPRMYEGPGYDYHKLGRIYGRGRLPPNEEDPPPAVPGRRSGDPSGRERTRRHRPDRPDRRTRRPGARLLPLRLRPSLHRPCPAGDARPAVVARSPRPRRHVGDLRLPP